MTTTGGLIAYGAMGGDILQGPGVVGVKEYSDKFNCVKYPSRTCHVTLQQSIVEYNQQLNVKVPKAAEGMVRFFLWGYGMFFG